MAVRPRTQTNSDDWRTLSQMSDPSQGPTPAVQSYFEDGTGEPSVPGRILSVDDLPEIELAPGLHSRPLVGLGMLASFVRYEPHSVAPLHAHSEEQIFIVLEGELEITLGDEVRTVGVGEAAHIPPWVPHTVRSLGQPAYQLDIFSPPRRALLNLLGQTDHLRSES